MMAKSRWDNAEKAMRTKNLPASTERLPSAECRRYETPQAATRYDELRLRAIAAQRAALHRLRARGEMAKKSFTAFSRSSTGPSSMPRQPAAFNRWRVEANCWRWARGRSNPGSLPEESPKKA
jgi:hypothetical protein